MPSRLLLLPAALALAAGLTACGTDEGSGSAGAGQASEATPSGPTTDCTYQSDGQEPAKDVDPPSSEAPTGDEVSVTLKTNQGDIGATLDTKTAPCTVHSFVSLAQQGYFDDTPCHRLTTAGIFVLQCGDPSGTGMQGPGYAFGDELTGEESYGVGTIAMANAGPNTNGSQFFLVYDRTQLPPSYTVFGTMDDAGVDVVREIAKAGVEGGQPDGPPAEQVTIESAQVE